jgi:hypothetical protein
MAYEYYLKRNNTSWRPSYVRNQKDFANVIENYRSKYFKAARGSEAKRMIVANFNKAYNSWIVKVKNENTKRRAKESAFFANLRAAKKSGNAAAINAVLTRYANGGNSPVRSVAAAAARQRPSVARLTSPKRSGKKRNTGNLRKAMANRNLNMLKSNLMAQKAALEYERNKLETQIFTLIRKIGELPTR